MKRWDSLHPSSKQRGRGRRRTAPLQPFDTVPAELVETAKRMFNEQRTNGSGNQPNGEPQVSERHEDNFPFLEFRALVPGFSSSRNWKVSW